MGANKGRGAGSNETGRFEAVSYERIAPIPGEEELALKTTFYVDRSKSIVTHNESPDVGFTASVNAYRGCEHGCIYCYARPTHEYLGFSAGLDFETKIFVKTEAPKLLRDHLLAKKYSPEVIVFSGITDCYQPAERRFRLTRSCLEVMKEFKNPFAIITKNHLVTRDIDIIAPMAEIGAAAVYVSVTSLDAKVCEVLEPRTSRPEARLEVIRKLSAAGIPVGVMLAPMIPGLNDHEIPKILEAAHEAGAEWAGFVPVRLPLSVAPLFIEWLGHHFPNRKEKIVHRIQSMRGGKLNDANFGSRMRGEGEFAAVMRQMFHQSLRRLGMNLRDLSLSTVHFERPGDQLSLCF